MECNKDEATRAKQIAEKKMENLDFEGARRIAQKAQALYPDLENISQLLSICNVHCSAQMRILGAEKDWYGILQVEKLADEPTLRKQYRRLALNLHPDKNRFPGAEAAFKLIVEANAVLSDPAKKLVYDGRIRSAGRTSGPVNLPPHHVNTNRTSQFSRQHAFGGLNQHHVGQPSDSVWQEVFLTICPFCRMKHQYPRLLLNTMLTCRHCLKKFVGYEITGPVIPTESRQGPPVMTQTGINFGPGNSVSREASQWRANRRAARQDTQQQATASGGGKVENAAKAKEENVVKTRFDVKEKHGDGHEFSSFNVPKEGANRFAANREKVNGKNKNRKRKQMVSESSDSSSDSDLETVGNMRIHDLNSGPSHCHPVRRSSRKRQNVTYTYTEGDDEDDIDVDFISPEISRGNKAYEDAEEEHNGPPNQTETVGSEESKLDKGVGEGQCTENGISDDGADVIKIESEDPEFNDFVKLRDEKLFAVNQIWACYDTCDSMPRFHAKVKKVSHAPFQLSFMWLEPDPIDEDHKKWNEAHLPVSCGTFKLGKTDITDAIDMFSHQVLWEKGKKRCSFLVYPRPGEIWALFRGWDLNWSSSPEDHKAYKYEIIEILTDFNVFNGLKVCYLDKVAGFVSLFIRSNQAGVDPFMVRPNELYKFSHQVPSYKMTGSEREGVPTGSFELDTASLPLNPDDLYYPGKAMMCMENVNHGAGSMQPTSE